MKARYFVICGLLTAGVMAASLIALPHLPDTVPMHWGLNGQPDGYGSKLALALTLPAVMAGLTLLFAVLPALSPKHFKIDSFMSTYLRVAAAVIGILAYAQVLMLLAGLGRPVNMNRAIPGAICVLMVLIGNVLGKMRRNFFVGIRTPWTLADERVWNATHRFGAKVWTIGGAVAFVLTFATGNIWVFISAILITAFTPVVYSFVFYKKLERLGEV
jgi:uncharacterized membrane protein